MISRSETHQLFSMAGWGAAVAVAMLLAGSLGAAVEAQETGTVTVDVQECLEKPSAEERLACFATEVDAALEPQSATGSEDAAAAPRDDRSAPERTASDEAPSAPLGRRRARAVDTPRETEAPEGEFLATITDLQERLPSAYLITLDNGQVWEQVEPKRYPLRPGLEVRVYPTQWGSAYRMTGRNSGSFIVVRRVR